MPDARDTASRDPRPAPPGVLGQAFQANVAGQALAIRQCLDSQLHTPALVLIYSGIDMMASLCRPLERTWVTRDDFVAWAETYMACQGSLGVSGLDLYAARCGVVHTYTADSRLSAEGRARPILYAWGNKTTTDATHLLERLNRVEVMLHIETLFEGYCAGVSRVCDQMDADATFRTLVLKRSNRLFINRSTFP